MSSFTPLIVSSGCYHVTAALVQLPGTFALRIVLLPITLYSTFYSITTFDATKEFGEPRLNYLNYVIGVGMLMMSMRALDWTFCKERPQRIPVQVQNRSPWTFIKDTLDLTINQRGLGWSWSKKYTPPPQTRPTGSTLVFLSYTLASAVIHHMIGDYAHFLAQCTDWDRFSDPKGTSLFDHNLAPIPRYLLSSYICTLTALLVYCRIQLLYDLSTLVLIPITNYSPLDWPPLFDAPWNATSLADFWANRWHSLFRHVFIRLGVKPLTFFVGRRSGLGLIGGFIISGILHDWGTWGMGHGLDFLSVGGFFIMQGVGVFLEVTLLARLFGGKVGGFKGWFWTMFWMIPWSNMMVDAWARRGMFASLFVPDEQRPSVIIHGLIHRFVAAISS